MDDGVPASQPIVDREKTAPFLIRTFVKIGGFHRLTLFEDGSLPTTDEHQVFTWKDATLREVLTTLRNVAPHVAEYKHPLARFSFRVVFADPGNKGRFSSKDLGMVYSRDILGEPGSLHNTAPRLLEDYDGEHREPTEREKEERTLEELRLMPGDYLCVAVLLPKNVNMPSEAPLKSSGLNTGASWKRGDSGWGGSLSSSAPGRGGGHWRGGSDAPPSAAPRGRGRGRGRDSERPPLPRRDDRDSPPRRGGGGGGWGRRRSPPARDRSRSPKGRGRRD